VRRRRAICVSSWRQREIVGGEFRVENEANAFEVGGVGLIGGLRGFDGAAALADEITS